MSLLELWKESDSYFDDLAVFGLGFFHPGGLRRTRKIIDYQSWQGNRVLDVGCGLGTTMKMLESVGADVFGVDASPFMIAGSIRSGINKERLIQASIEILPLPSEPFDAIIIEGVLGFINEPIVLLHKLKRFLAPAGLIAISDWEPHERTVESRLANDYGFKIVKETYPSELFGAVGTEYVVERLDLEDDVAKSSSLTIQTAVNRVRAFFQIDSIDQALQAAIVRKVDKMNKVLCEELSCRSYLAILRQRTL